MDKNTFDKIRNYATQCSISVCGNMVPIYDGSTIMPDELGWATEKGIYINYKHPLLDSLPFNKQTVFLLGVITHEMMHKVYSDFDVLKYGMSKYKGDSTMQRLVKEIANLIEDPAIEYMAQFKIGGYLLKCLRYSVRVIYNLNPVLEESKYPLSQLMSAYILYGDMGIIKGNFTFPEAEEAFIKTVAIMDKAIDSFSAKKRFLAAEEVAEIIKDLMDIDDTGDDAMDDFDNQMSESGRSKAPQGKGSAKEELEEDNNTSSSSSEEQKKKNNRQKTRKQMSQISGEQGNNGKSEKSENENGNQYSGKSGKSDKSDKEKSSKQSQSGNDDKGSEDGKNGSDEDKNSSGNDESNSESNQNESSSNSDDTDNNSSNGERSNGNNDDEDSNNNSSSSNSPDTADTDADSNADQPEQADMNNLPESHRQQITGERQDITSGDGIGLNEGETSFEDNLYEISEEDIKAIMEEIKEQTAEEPVSFEGDLDEFTETSEEVKEFNLKVENKMMEVGGNITSLQAAYNDVIGEVGDIISRLNRNLKHIFREDVEEKNYTTTGKVSLKRLSSGRQTARVFEKVRMPKNKQQMKVCVLVDESGSMSCNGKAVVAKKTAIILAEVFDKLNIPVAVMGFTTGLRGYQVNHHHYLHWDNSPTNRLKLLNISANGGNYDAFAVRTAAKMMKKKKSTYDILIIISDGEPSFGLGKRGERLTDLANTVHQTKKQVKNIIGIGLGDINTTAFEKFYGNDFIHVPNINDLPISLTNAIKRMVKKW